MKTNYTPLRFFQNAAQEFSKGSEKIAIDSPTGAKLPQQTEQHRNMITIRYVKLLGKVEDLVERKCYILSAFFARMAEKLYKRKNRMANGAGGDENPRYRAAMNILFGKVKSYEVGWSGLSYIDLKTLTLKVYP